MTVGASRLVLEGASNIIVGEREILRFADAAATISDHQACFAGDHKGIEARSILWGFLTDKTHRRRLVLCFIVFR